MIKTFDEFNSKMKFITRTNTNAELAKILDIPQSSYQTMKNNDKVPYEKALEYLKDKNVDLNWLFKLKQENS